MAWKFTIPESVMQCDVDMPCAIQVGVAPWHESSISPERHEMRRRHALRSTHQITHDRCG